MVEGGEPREDALPPAARLQVGRIGRPHGLRGEVTVVLVTDRPERTAPGAALYAGDREIVVERARTQRQGWIVQFVGITDRAAAESLRNLTLWADPLEGEDGTWWVHELIGCGVVDRSGRDLGHVRWVEANPAHDLLVLDGGTLIPMPFVIGREPGRIVVDPPDGLLDL